MPYGATSGEPAYIGSGHDFSLETVCVCVCACSREDFSAKVQPLVKDPKELINTSGSIGDSTNP